MLNTLSIRGEFILNPTQMILFAVCCIGCADSSTRTQEDSSSADGAGYVQDADQPQADMDLELADMTPDATQEVPMDMGEQDARLVQMPDVGQSIDQSVTDASDPSDVPMALTATECFMNQFPNMPEQGPNYDQFEPTVGSHCYGTNHQVIEDIERVVFVGDSVTVGTPPQWAHEYYRSRLAQSLSVKFGLMPPDQLWEGVNIFDGTSLTKRSGGFTSCARYGARTDDLIQDNALLTDCFEPEDFARRTLIIMTIGGNDISSLTQDGINGETPERLWEKNQQFVGLMRDAIAWIRTPERFPNGVNVVFSNMFEFTDGTGDVSACPAAGLAGFGAEWEDPQLLADLVIWANEQYMSIAVEYAVDMIFMLEHFCGHGFNAQDSTAPCYRGPDAETWFDLTCIHPNAQGHAEITRLFNAVIDE